jgi:hypothetical protein
MLDSRQNTASIRSSSTRAPTNLHSPQTDLKSFLILNFRISSPAPQSKPTQQRAALKSLTFFRSLTLEKSPKRKISTFSPKHPTNPPARDFCFFVSRPVVASYMPFFDFLRKSNDPESAPVQLTPRVQRVLELAQESATRHQRDTPSTADVSIALLQLGGGVACNILRQFGITEVALQNPTFANADSPYTDLIPVAEQEMRPLNHTYLGTEHLLLAILKIKNTPLAAALLELGVTTRTVREEILRELDPNYVPPSENET